MGRSIDWLNVIFALYLIYLGFNIGKPKNNEEI
jgi:hypothetical protein